MRICAEHGGQRRTPLADGDNGLDVFAFMSPRSSPLARREPYKRTILSDAKPFRAFRVSTISLDSVTSFA
jgi:hypothetical protein